MIYMICNRMYNTVECVLYMKRGLYEGLFLIIFNSIYFLLLRLILHVYWIPILIQRDHGDAKRRDGACNATWLWRCLTGQMLHATQCDYGDANRPYAACHATWLWRCQQTICSMPRPWLWRCLQIRCCMPRHVTMEMPTDHMLHATPRDYGDANRPYVPCPARDYGDVYRSDAACNATWLWRYQKTRYCTQRHVTMEMPTDQMACNATWLWRCQ